MMSRIYHPENIGIMQAIELYERMQPHTIMLPQQCSSIKNKLCFQSYDFGCLSILILICKSDTINLPLEKNFVYNKISKSFLFYKFTKETVGF